MPTVTSGPLKGFYLPDYDGGCIVNLLSSIIRSRGGRSPHAELNVLPARELAGAGKVVYVLVDGLGRDQLRRHLARGGGRAFFARHEWETISTVFPATTAAAVSTFATGATPAEHGVLSWFLHLPDLGAVSTILPLTTRMGAPLAPADFDMAAYLDQPSYLNSTKGRRAFLAYGGIAGGLYSRVATRWKETGSFQTLNGMVRRTVAFARGRGRGLAYVYWPGYDTLCHEAGTTAPGTVNHLEEIDSALARLVKGLGGTDTYLVVVADHGLVDTPRGRMVNLAEVPGFYECLAMLPSGDARQVSCFVRPRREKVFLRLVRENLAASCACVRGDELLARGVFGPGRPHAALAGRVGDYVLLARGPVAFSYPPAQGDGRGQIGNHGGMSEREERVPLYALRG